MARQNRTNWVSVFRVGLVLWATTCAVFLQPSAALWAAETDRPQADLPFNRDIRPILAAKCYQCHGPDHHKRKADLRLDSREGIESAFVAGQLEESEAWLRITSDDDDGRMPPPSSKLELLPAEADRIRIWIENGATWQDHWSLIAPTLPAIPAVSRAAWVRNPIDAFILARLESEGLMPSPESDRERLLRRVTCDLTGLPPTLAEIDDFLLDSRPDAYERVVDRLLESNHFGERMAVAWLDAARYGDTSVFHADGPRDMWPWRDWVIRAYNDNKPFDEFTREQLAGDLIENASAPQKIATGFNRNNATTDEGGAIAEEFRVEYAVDRVKTTSMVWLGLTMECGQCHEHKYDPISQEEYYRFFAFFNQAADPGMQTRGGNQQPIVDVHDPQQQAKLKTIRVGIERLQADREARVAGIDREFDEWLAAVESGAIDVPFPPKDAVLHVSLDEREGTAVADVSEAGHQGTLVGEQKWGDGKFAGSLILDGKNFVKLGDVGDFQRTDAFSYGCWVKPQGEANGAPIARMDDGNGHRGYDLLLTKGQIAVHLIHHWPDNAIKVVTKNKLEKDRWQHVFVTYDGSSKASGLTIYIDGKAAEFKPEADQLSDSMRTEVPLHLGRRNPGSPFRGAIDEVRIYPRELSEEEVQSLGGHGAVLGPIVRLSREQRTAEQVETLRKIYLEDYDAAYQSIQKELDRLLAEEVKAAKPISTVMVMRDVDKPRMTYMLQRGNYASPLKENPVQPGVPAALPPLPPKAPPNRLGLAQWLTMDDHPLTARVTVNRYWYMLFGTGLVKTVEDFGSQGEWPSHPALLDWLAVDFMRNGWNIKRAIKQIVTSSTYRQSSRVSQPLLQRDAENRLLARGPRFRLQGEFVRDNALAASGLLVRKIGGPSVKPYQPSGLWNEVSINTNLRFVQDHGEKLYRRSMYIYWKRSAPPPSMSIFDAPSRESCTIRRSRTNTPLQALVVLNDPQFVEAARALAERVIREGGSLREQITTAYRLAAGVRPRARAVEILANVYQRELPLFEGDPQRASALLKIGESPRADSLNAAQHAAMTIVTSMILNLDETLTRG